MAAAYARGLTTLDQETVIDRLPVRGTLPAWLQGTLVRNGPARFEVGAQSYRHWFDGLAMLHRFSFKDGVVSYANRYLRSRDYVDSMAEGRITYAGFATDPCRAIFRRFFALFSPLAATDNANVNVTQIAGHAVALTETPLPIAFDPHTLETLSVFNYDMDHLPGHATTAHPHFDFERQAGYNYLLEFGRECKYHVYTLPAGQARRAVLGSLRVQEPAYMHSFGMTENYIILAEFPLVVNPLRLLMRGKPFIENYEWQPQRGVRFIVMSKRDATVRTYQGDAFFAFHHVNAYEKGSDIVLDIAAYPDKSLIDAFYLDKLRAGVSLPAAQLRRYRLSLFGGDADYETLSGESIELPRLAYRQVNGRPYRYVYGVSTAADTPGDFNNQLVKINVADKTAQTWRASGGYVGEPVFVPAPGSQTEDGGVVLSVVLDAARGTSYLLVLDAATFAELARAEVPHHIPFGFHGQFWGEL